MFKSVPLVSSFLLCSLLGLSHQRITTGSCTTPQLQEKFDAQRYTGRWYEVRRDNGQFGENDYDCENAIYTLNTDGTLHVKNSGFSLTNQTYFDVEGDATCVGPQCTVVFFNRPADYRVLYTDYDNFGIVYSCTDLEGLAKFEGVWVLSRTKTATDDQVNKVLSILSERVPEYNLEALLSPRQEGTCQYEDYTPSSALFLQ